MSGLALLLGTVHSVVGALSLAAPYHSAGLFGLTPVHSSNFIGRLFGCRELILGGSLVLSVRQNRSRAERFQLLNMINLMNAIDVVSGLVDFYQGTLSNKGLLLTSGGAFCLLITGMLQASSW